jgi:hypothetical protein
VLSKRATALEEHVGKLGLPVEGLKIKVADDVAYVKGKVPTQADGEKVVLRRRQRGRHREGSRTGST